MREAEHVAKSEGKTLLVLDAVTDGDAARLYARLGWVRVGDIPGYALMPRGGLASTTYYYRALDETPRSTVETLRALLDRTDLEVVAIFDTQLAVRDGRTNVAWVQQMAPGAWTAFGCAKHGGGWALHADGATAEIALRTLLAHGEGVLRLPMDPIGALPSRIVKALETNEGTREERPDGTAFRWSIVYAADDWAEAHRALRAATRVMKARLQRAPITTKVRRTGGPTLTGLVWDDVALFETDHDPGAGALLVVARWERGKPGALPPWG